MPFIVNTGSASNEYRNSRPVKHGDSVHYEFYGDAILIKGGQGVMDGRSLFTPDNGVITEVTDEQLAYLLENPLFKLHQANGFIKIIRTDSAKEQKKAAEDMVKSDDGAQLTPEDFEQDAAKTDEGELTVGGTKVKASNRVSKKRAKKIQ